MEQKDKTSTCKITSLSFLKFSQEMMIYVYTKHDCADIICYSYVRAEFLFFENSLISYPNYLVFRSKEKFQINLSYMISLVLKFISSCPQHMDKKSRLPRLRQYQ